MRSRDANLAIALAAALAVAELADAGTAFRRGDFNQDASFDIGDSVATLNYLFVGTFTPACVAAGDTNDDGAVELSDAIYGLGFLFLGGPAPRPPFPGCGDDPTADGLGCERYAAADCPAGGRSPILAALAALERRDAEVCCIPVLGVFTIAGGLCERLGGRVLAAGESAAACAEPAPPGARLVFAVPPPAYAEDPVVPIVLILSLRPERVPTWRPVAFTIDLYALRSDGERTGPVRLADVPVPDGAAAALEFVTITGEVVLPEGLEPGSYVLDAAYWSEAPPDAAIDELWHGPEPPVVEPALFASVVATSPPFAVGATGPDLATTDELADLLGSDVAGDPFLNSLAADVLSTRDALVAFDATLSSPEIDSLRRRLADLSREKAEAQNAAAVAEAEKADNEAAQEPLEDELTALVLLNRWLDEWVDGVWGAIIEDLIRRRGEVLGGAAEEDREAVGEALDEKRRRLEEVCAELEAKKAALEALERRHEERKEEIREQYRIARRFAGRHRASIEIGDDGVSYDVSGIHIGSDGKAIHVQPPGKRFAEEQKKLDEMIAEYEAEWLEILACREEIERLENEKEFLEGNIAKLENAAAEVDEIDEILDEIFDAVDSPRPERPSLARLAELLERAGAGWLAELLRCLFEKAPKTAEELEKWKEKLADLRERKHAREAELEDLLEELRRQAAGIQDRIDEAKRRCAEAEDAIARAKEDLERAEDEARRIEQEEHDRARAAAQAEAEKRRRQAELDRKIDDLRRRIQEGDEGALAELVELVGLNALDEILPDIKLGSIIGAALTIADMPECLCELLKALKELFRNSSSIGRDALANDVVRKWRECAGGWIAISSAEIGATELANAVNRMRREDRVQVYAMICKALDREECR